MPGIVGVVGVVVPVAGIVATTELLDTPDASTADIVGLSTTVLCGNITFVVNVPVPVAHAHE